MTGQPSSSPRPTKLCSGTMDIVNLLVYIEAGVIGLFVLFALGVWISYYSGYIHIYRPNRRRQNYVDLEESTERDTNQTSGKDSDEVDNWIQKRLSLLEEIETPYQNQKEEIESLLEQLREERAENQALVAEKEEALKRLSAIMSSRLKDGNPNMADLNDQNRPTEVGEQFSELYDNQWTDAYGVVQTYFQDEKNEPEIIGILLDILEQCFMFCKDKANERLTHLKDGARKLALAVTKKYTKLVGDLMQRIREERKIYAVDELPQYNEFATNIKEHFSVKEANADFLDDLTVIKFTQECLKLCWLMAMQDPPMSMVLAPTKNVHDHFKAYRHRGNQLSFVVWPALLLEESGPLVLKGIAEFHE